MTFYQTITTEDLSLFYPVCILLSSSNVSKKFFFLSAILLPSKFPALGELLLLSCFHLNSSGIHLCILMVESG